MKKSKDHKISIMLGKALREMALGLRLRPIMMIRFSPIKIETGKKIVERMKIKYPLKRDARGRMMKAGA